jgi:hypothetical protein
MLLQHRVHLLTSRACDVAGMLCKLGPASMQLAESLLESLLKVRALPRQYLYFLVLVNASKLSISERAALSAALCRRRKVCFPVYYSACLLY